MRIRIGSPFLLTIISIFSILFFATSVAAQSPQNRLLSPEEASALGYDTGNPPGPYYKTERGVFELNGKDGPQPPNGPGYAGVGCDSRQDPAIYSSPNADPSRFKSWESGSCMENGKPCCVNIDLAGYPINLGDPRYVITDSQREQCKNIDQAPPFIQRDLKEICDFIAQNGNAIAAPGNPGGGIGGDAVAAATEARFQAEQQVATVQEALASATATRQETEQQLATARDALANATAAVQTAEQAVQNETAQRDAELAEKLRIAEAERKAFEDRLQQEAEERQRLADEEAARLAQLEEERLAALEAARKEAEQAREAAATEAAKKAADMLAQQVEDLAAVQTAAADAKSIRQAVEEAAKQAAEQAAQSPDNAEAQLAATEAAQKAAEALLVFNQQAEAAQKEAVEAAQKAAEDAAQQANELANLQASLAAAEAAQKAANDWAQQAAGHAEEVKQAFSF